MLHRKLTLLVVLIIPALTPSSIGLCQSVTIPNAHLEITVQQREEGKLSQALHLWDLFCWDDSCDLVILTLNQCSPNVYAPGGTGPSFFPTIERFSTRDGNLTVKNTGGALDIEVRVAHITGDAVFKARLGYRKPGQRKFVTEPTSFTGAAVKHSEVLKKAITWELVPLRGKWHRIRLDCSAVLPGLWDE